MVRPPYWEAARLLAAARQPEVWSAFDGETALVGVDWEAMSAASFLNAFTAWLRDKYQRTEEGRHKWQMFWAFVTAPPPDAHRRRLASVPAPQPADVYED